MNLKLAFKKWFTMIEMTIVIVIIAIVIWFAINSFSNNDILSNEQNISKHLKTYATNLKMLKTNQIDSLKKTSWKNLFTNWDSWTNKQWFVWVISNCQFPAWQFWDLETHFSNKFRIATVWPKMWAELDLSSVDSIKSVLSKLTDWKMTFISWKKSDFLDKTSPEYNWIWNYIHILVVEHSKAWSWEFFSEETWEKKYYNAVVLDSEWNIHDWLSSKQTIRQLLTEWATKDKDYNEITELNKKVMKKVIEYESKVCVQK